MKQIIERNLFDILLAVILFVAIGLCVHSCNGCRQAVQELEQTKERYTVLITN